jgi:dTMP kinase
VPGRFITLEGGEGAGKTTLMKGLSAHLGSLGHDVIRTREPGGTPGAESLREILLTGATDRWSPVTEALLMYAARVDHVERLISPALEAGSWVMSDRFADSTLAYQGAAGGMPLDRIRTLHTAALGEFAPNLTLILDLDPRAGLERVEARGEDTTRFERFDAGFHTKLRQAFLDIAEQDPKRCVVIDASQPVDAVLDEAIRAVSDRLN